MLHIGRIKCTNISVMLWHNQNWNKNCRKEKSRANSDGIKEESVIIIFKVAEAQV